MIDREKVIKGLECCNAYDYKCNDCPYRDDGGATDGRYSDELKADILALLKAQEPRLIELDEFEYGLDWNVPLYFEQRDGISGWDIYRGLERGTSDIITSAEWAEDQTWQREYYGKEWRCWTGKPTKEQREAAKWE